MVKEAKEAKKVTKVTLDHQALQALMLLVLLDLMAYPWQDVVGEKVQCLKLGQVWQDPQGQVTVHLALPVLDLEAAAQVPLVLLVETPFMEQ